MSVTKPTGSVLVFALLAFSRVALADGTVYAVEVPAAEVVRLEISIPEGTFARKGDPDEEIIEIDPDEITVDPGKPRPGLWDLCRRAASRERGTRLLCAKRVDGDSLQLLLGGPPRETSWTLAVEAVGEDDSAVGEDDPAVGFYDREGRSLAAGDGVVDALVPGLYLVRVAERHDGEAPYALSLAATTW